MRPQSAAVLSLVLASCCCKPPGGSAPGGTSTASPGSPPSSTPAQVVDIKTLLGDYKGNEVKGDSLYKGKVIQTTGTVGEIKKDILNSIYVTVGTGAAFEIPIVQCMVPKSQEAKAGALTKGTKITVKGTVSGLMMNVIVRDCEIQ